MDRQMGCKRLQRDHYRCCRDPFCFQVFPGNTSEGKLCYRHDSGSQSYDMSGGETGPHTLYEDLILDSKVGKVESKVIHQGQNFWVVNHFPWYALGIHQCICTEAHQGADPSQPGSTQCSTTGPSSCFTLAEN